MMEGMAPTSALTTTSWTENGLGSWGGLEHVLFPRPPPPPLTKLAGHRWLWERERRVFQSWRKLTPQPELWRQVKEVRENQEAFLTTPKC